MGSTNADQPASADSPVGGERDISGGTPDVGPATSRSVLTPATPPTEGSPDSDTLLSAPAPADTWETELEDRLSAARERLEELEARVRALEARALPEPPPVRVPAGFLWVAFLLLLALVFQVVVRLKGH